MHAYFCRKSCSWSSSVVWSNSSNLVQVSWDLLATVCPFSFLLSNDISSLNCISGRNGYKFGEGQHCRSRTTGKGFREPVQGRDRADALWRDHIFQQLPVRDGDLESDTRAAPAILHQAHRVCQEDQRRLCPQQGPGVHILHPVRNQEVFQDVLVVSLSPPSMYTRTTS